LLHVEILPQRLLCATCVLCVFVVNRRDTESTEVAQRHSLRSDSVLDLEVAGSDVNQIGARQCI
jgi:hypothetical protein